MKITSFRQARENVETSKLTLNKIIVLAIAHTFEYGYWKNYSYTPCRIAGITPEKLTLQDVNHPDTYASLDIGNMDGQFQIHY